MAVNNGGGASMASVGGDTLIPMPPNCDSSGVHFSRKSHLPSSPVWSTTGRSSTYSSALAYSPIVVFVSLMYADVEKLSFGGPFGGPRLLVSFGPPFAAVSAYTESSRFSLCTFNPNRSPSTLRTIDRNCARFAWPGTSGTPSTK